ncbi:MAG: Hsp33 family molecular chaperone HslO [Mollicutes bacterium PWAP]|nr:Hsp33 family molecular chaperone HslO [Mollicutes bacterium PWAP]
MKNLKILIKNEVRIYLSDTTELTNNLIKTHKTKPLASRTLGTAAGLFSTFGLMRKEIYTSVNIKGDGPLKNIIVESNPDGGIRALIGNPFVQTEYDQDIDKANTIPISLGVGSNGVMNVVNRIENIGSKISNFGGMVNLVSGNITLDLAFYFDQSEQTFSAVDSFTLLKNANNAKSTINVIFQMMPKHKKEDIIFVEKFIKNHSLKKVSFNKYLNELIKEGAELKDERKIFWHKTCSKDKMFKAIASLTNKDIEELKEKYGAVEVKCHFCNSIYRFFEK